jgi:high-affinity Fe2+/Pb2+ permease
MSQKNETTILVLSILITAGLIAGGFWWFSRKSGVDLNAILVAPKHHKLYQNNPVARLLPQYKMFLRDYSIMEAVHLGHRFAW